MRNANDVCCVESIGLTARSQIVSSVTAVAHAGQRGLAVPNLS